MSEFDEWNKRKQNIHLKNKRVYVKEGEIRWCQLGQNIGYEECGTGKDFDRPVLIVKIFSRETCLVVPLTSSAKKHRFRFEINNKSKALLSQIKTIDTKRLSRLIYKIRIQDFKQIKKAIQDLFE